MFYLLRYHYHLGFLIMKSTFLITHWIGFCMFTSDSSNIGHTTHGNMMTPFISGPNLIWKDSLRGFSEIHHWNSGIHTLCSKPLVVLSGVVFCRTRTSGAPLCHCGLLARRPRCLKWSESLALGNSQVSSNFVRIPWLFRGRQ